MKKTVITAIILSLVFSMGATAYAAEHAEKSEASATVRRTSAAPADYVPEPVEEIITEKRIPEGQQGRGELINLNYEYGRNGYPDYISYVEAYDKFLDENNNTVIQYRVGITEMSQENMDEVLELAAESCYIVFEQASHSYNERMEVFDSLRKEFPDCYIIEDWQAKQFILVTSDDETQNIIQTLGKRYSDLVLVADSSGNIYDRAGNPTGRTADIMDTGIGREPVIGGDTGVYQGTDPVGEAKSGIAPIIAVIAATAVLLLAGGFILSRKAGVKLSTDGTAAASALLSRSDVKRLVSESAVTPRSQLRERILK